jgi:hypothetical protein
LNEGDTWDAIPAELLTDLGQLTKANSIEGNKKDNITVIYTPWSNLKKDGSMAVGQVSFHDQKKVGSDNHPGSGLASSDEPHRSSAYSWLNVRTRSSTDSTRPKSRSIPT